MGEYLTPEMVSKLLHIGMNKTYKLFKIKGFPAVKIGNQWLVEGEDLRRFLSEYNGSQIALE
ncbi:MAG: helix-turn-helix domain-containing protein [Lachnospiraceae bacterium]|nr:helix-turn-helix domain-containing protein [Lachnospiraceae bacterium]